MKGVKWNLILFINRQNQDQGITLTEQKEAAAASGSADTPSTTAHVCLHAPCLDASSPTLREYTSNPHPGLSFGYLCHALSNENSTLCGKSLLPIG